LKGYQFNGVDNYLDFGTTRLGGELTIAFWANIESFDSWSRFIDFGNGAG
jgi:hypothetical protein